MYTTAFHFTQAFRGQLTSLRRLSYEATFVLVPGGGEEGKRPLLQGFPSYELRLVVAALKGAPHVKTLDIQVRNTQRKQAGREGPPRSANLVPPGSWGLNGQRPDLGYACASSGAVAGARE